MHDYEPWLVPFVPLRGEVAIDVGANRGVWTRELAKRFVHVHALEPNPEILPSLRENLATNVTVYEVAAWNEKKVLSFNRYPCPDHLSAFNKGTLLGQIGVTGPSLGEVELPAVPLDTLPISGKIDFLKCDTEGAEFQVITGATKLIQENRPPLLIEIHAARNGKMVKDLLGEWHYRLTVIPHPLHGKHSPYRAEHFWISAMP